MAAPPALARRQLLGHTGAAGLCLALGGGLAPLLLAEPALAAARRIPLPRTRSLWAANMNVREQSRLTYVRNGFYDNGALKGLDWLLRDHHEDRYEAMSRKLYDILFVTQQTLAPDAPILITSGFRTERTNRRLAERIPGVANNSYHLQGEAVDFRIPGVTPKALHKFLTGLKVGGTGLYARHVHLDTGPVRQWR